MVERNPELLSASIRRVDGRAMATVGDHRPWDDAIRGHSTDTQVLVPIWAAGQQWGQVELRFAPLRAPGWLGLAQSPLVRLVGFLTLATFVVFLLYLRKMLQHLDPSQAVPQHVRSALDTLAEGLLVLDLKQQIVLATQAFASMLGQSSESLMGRSAADLPWVQADGSPFPEAEFPWARALTDGSLQRNVMIHLESGGEQLTFLVNCSPVLGSGGRYGGVLVSLDDVSQLEEHKAELSAAKEEADSSTLCSSSCDTSSRLTSTPP